MIIDAQVHAYERNKPSRPWAAVLAGPDEVTGDDMVKAMDQVGVDGAILVSPYTMYQYDPSYALEVYAKHPTRFGLVRPFDPADPAVGEQVAEWKAKKGAVGTRIMMNRGISEDPADPGIARMLAAAAKHSLPVNMLCWGRLEQLDGIAERNPNTMLVMDHLGLHQPFALPLLPQPWEDLPKVLKMARHPNVVIKISGACTLSQQKFPYDDIWAPLKRIFDAFGLDRCLWGTDWTRATALLTYKEGVDSFLNSKALSDSDRATLMAGSLSRVYNWKPGRA